METTFEVAFLGRSNVGKSSLLNSIFSTFGHGRDGGAKKLARTSKQPGRTRHAHFFGWFRQNQKNQEKQHKTHDLMGVLIDLPGYGYAVGPDKAVDSWQKRTQQLLVERTGNTSHATFSSLKNVYLLIDSRHGATPFDWSVMGWMRRNSIPYSIVMTKADAVARPFLLKHLNQICMGLCHQVQEEQEHNALNRSTESSTMNPYPAIHITSSRNKDGVEELLFRSIARYLELYGEDPE